MGDVSLLCRPLTLIGVFNGTWETGVLLQSDSTARLWRLAPVARLQLEVIRRVQQLQRTGVPDDGSQRAFTQGAGKSCPGGVVEQ